MSSIDDKEPELNPSALENLDTSGYSFIPDLTTSPNSSINGEKNSNANTEEDKFKLGEQLERKVSDSDIFKEKITSTPLQRHQKNSNDSDREEVPSIVSTQYTPVHYMRMKHLESTPDAAMTSANSSGFFGLSDLEDSPLHAKVRPFLLISYFLLQGC